MQYTLISLNIQMRYIMKRDKAFILNAQPDITFCFTDAPTYSLVCIMVGGLVVSVLSTGPKVRGFDPDRGRWIFKDDKNPEHHFLRRGSKAIGPMS
jgi:hypothetical protein